MDPLLDSRPLQNDSPLRIGVIYNISPESAKGRENEKVADREVVEIAQAIQACLQSQGYISEIVELKPDGYDELLRYDWIFNLAETIYGFPQTDYQIAAELERRKLHFTGAGSASLKACRDKAFTKNELNRNGLSTPPFEVFPPESTIQTHLSFPLFVKPLYEDGSFGITKDSRVNTPEELIRGVRRIHERYQQPALVEKYIDGIDVSVSIIGNDQESVILPLSEIIYTCPDCPQYMTFPAIWLPESREYKSNFIRCPANLDQGLANVIGETALKASRIMKCQDYTRVDFRLKGDTQYILEVNPNPCINPHESGFVSAADAAGYSFCDLVINILHHSMKRQTLLGNHVAIGVEDVIEPSSSNT